MLLLLTRVLLLYQTILFTVMSIQTHFFKESTNNLAPIADCSDEQIHIFLTLIDLEYSNLYH